MGRIYDDAGNRMTPVNAQNGPARYRYYLSAPLNHGAPGRPGSISRIPARHVEGAVVAAARERLSKSTDGAGDAENPDPESDISDHQLIEKSVTRVVVSRQSVAITFNAGDKQNEDSGSDDQEPEIVIAPLNLKNRKPRREIIRDREETSDPDVGMRSERHQTLLVAIAKARCWADDLIAGRVADTEALARRENCSERRIRMTLSLAFLAPDIVAAALANRLPPHLVMTRIWSDLPLSWAEQRKVLRLGSPIL